MFSGLGIVGPSEEVQFQIPVGSSGVYQNTGSLSLVPYLSFAQNFGRDWRLGSINAARRHVYQHISALRHRMNKRGAREPRAGETAAEYLRSIADAG